MRILAIVSALTLSFALTGAAYALDAAAPPPAGGTAASTNTTTAKSAKSAECSKEADAKGLHGSARKKFREECKKGK